MSLMLGHFWNNVSVNQLKSGFFQNAELEKLPAFVTSPFFALCFECLRDHIKCPPFIGPLVQGLWEEWG